MKSLNVYLKNGLFSFGIFLSILIEIAIQKAPISLFLGYFLAFEGNSQVYFFEGSYSEYEENKKKRLGDDGPKRIKYRKLKAD